MAVVGIWSVRGIHDAPASIVFHTPPSAPAT
jgi:hypothetical protein